VADHAPINDRLERLADYPFTRLAELLDSRLPAAGIEPAIMSVGDPQHPSPAILAEAIAANAHLWHQYPPLMGTEDFREAVGGWLGRRYGLPEGVLDPHRSIMPVSGTREALFMAGLLAVPAAKAGRRPAAALPNPFYPAYEGAAVMAGAEPVPLAATAASGNLPDLDALSPGLLDRLAVFYLCSPANPQGAVADLAYLRRLIGLARRHGFVLAVDECYSEIWDRAAPPGLLEAAAGIDGGRLDNLLAFNSLSKRSNAAGLRSGFVAGDPALIAAFRALRCYAAAGMPYPVLAASAALWSDETHVATNRDRYRLKIDAAERTLRAAGLAGTFGFFRPAGGFFLWLDVGDGEAAALRLWRQAAVRVLPGAYLTRPGADGANHGRPFIRVALVHEPARIAEAMARLCETLAPTAATGS
jgi:aspartate/methionine/tyrosine aminotransferase